ncbi:MAG: response regulator [Eubacterium sp.]|nr:response regulator [Eubacterium sp.]
MKKKHSKILSLGLICFICLVAVVISFFYFNYITDKINDDSVGHLQEIYEQVNRTFSLFSERNWGLLESWNDTLVRPDDTDKNAENFISSERERWHFTDFYFLSENGTYKTADGEVGSIDLGESWDILMIERKPAMAGNIDIKSDSVTMFAVPVEPGSFQGFSYSAIALSYTNDALVSSLDIDTFADKADCFVIRENGSVLFSTKSGSIEFSNYLSFLKDTSDIDEARFSRLISDWENGNDGLLRCKINGEEYCILYRPLSYYHGYTLVSTVPQSSVSAAFLQAQRTTITVLIIIFLLVSASAISLIIISTRRQVSESKTELAYRDLMFDVLSNNIDDIFLMFDTENYNVDYISPNVERLFGIPTKEVQNDIRTILRCAVSDDVIISADKLLEIPLNGRIVQECEYLHQRTGERRWYRMTVYRMSINGVEKFINILSDRTQERQMTQTLEEALVAAKSANEAKSNFLSNVSHDIRTPMNAIVGFSTLIEKDAENPEKVLEYTHKISASSRHLLSLINEVLDMSKIESGKTSLNAEVFHLPKLLEELSIIMMPQVKAKNQEFSIHTHGSPPEHLIGDRLHLNQILINLLSNAVKYTPDGGKIEFSVCRIPDSTPQIVKLEFIVEDNGIGMSKEYLSQIFKPFSREVNSVTNKVQGTGLGMAITKNLIDLMGGVIRVESESGKGSIFTVELSFTLAEDNAEEDWYKKHISHILVVDDEPEVCKTIFDMMSDTGIEITCATSGCEAIEAAIKAHQSEKDFDVILLDWKMPDLDGVKTTQAIRKEIGNDIPIIVLTSYDWSDIEEEARTAGVHAFMPKPFFVSTFWQTVKPLFLGSTQFEKPVSNEKAESVLEGRHILIVEDNELNAEILTEMLDMEGAVCELAVNGEEAVKTFERSQAGQYDLIFMDVQMPILNGYEATRKIRSSTHPDAENIPIVAMTANTFAEDIREALDAGMNAHLGKPIDMNAVLDTVAQLLSNQNL